MDLDKIKKKRSAQKGLITRLLKNIDDALLKENQIGTFKVLLTQLNEKMCNLKLVNDEIYNACDAKDIETEVTTSEEHYENLIDYKCKIESKIEDLMKVEFKDLNQKNQNEISSINKKAEAAYVNLPRLVIEKFNGDPADWQRFWDQFESAIHKNPEISDIDKFNYLKNYTTNLAADSIKGFNLTNENYQAAIDTLHERFGQKSVLINAHLNNLLSLNCVKKSSDIPALRKMYDSCKTEIRNLKTLGIETSNFSSLLCPILIKQLPREIVLEITKKCDFEENWDIEKVLEILKDEINYREKTLFLLKDSTEKEHFSQLKNFSHKNEKMFQKNTKPHTAAELFNETQKRFSKCYFCEKENHSLSECKIFASLRFTEKRNFLMKNGLCFACLKRGHMTKTCRSFIKCTNCSKRHYNILCPENKDDDPPTFDRNKASKEKPENNFENALANKTHKQDVIMQTLKIRIKNNSKEIFARVLIDTGSMRSYITEKTARKIGYVPIGKEKMTHSLFGGLEETKSHNIYHVHISDMLKEFSCNFQAFGQETICSEIPKIRNGPWIKEAKEYGIKFSDFEGFNKFRKKNNHDVDILIGADICGKLLTGNVKVLSSGLAAVETFLGWTLMGKIPEILSNNNQAMTVVSLFAKTENLRELWDLDLLGIRDPVESKRKDELQKETLEYFNNTVEREGDGRYVVSLPWVKDHPPIANNRNVSEKRLKSTIRHLNASGNLEAYQNVFRDWQEQGIIERFPDTDDDSGYYLPHRAVIRPGSTTPLRPVFDASSKEKHAFSLNDCLIKGPNMIEMIPSILNKFRKGKIGLTADIKKAFCQISLKEGDRNFVKFLWYENGDYDKLQVFRHCRVVFGINCSPFLLAATLNHLLENVEEPFKKIAGQLKTSFYVDNCVSSVDSVEELREFVTMSRQILASAQFDLRGWQHTLIDEDSSSEEKSAIDEDIRTKEEKSDITILGLLWNIKEDTLRLMNAEEEFSKEEKITKRSILSDVNKIFDPIGYCCPATLNPKLLLQECWKRKINWDSSLPDDIRRSFMKFKEKLHILREIKIPRRLSEIDLRIGEKSLHVFCDSSKYAYSTCIFLRIQNEESVSGQLIQAKSRIAPLKEISIPRLELLSCLIGARLTNTVIKDLNLSNLKIHYWADSMNALYWIKNDGNWATFVQNRVMEIRKLTNVNDWHHVPGTLNPADLPSRGCSPEKLKRSGWWNLPEWLKKSSEFWPRNEIFPDNEIITLEKRKTVSTNLNVNTPEFLFYENCSSYKKMIRVTAWIFRFVENCKKLNEERLLTPLLIEELNKAENTVLKYAQRVGFPEEAKKNLPLKTFTDEKGIIRVRTRISSRDDLEDFRHPVLLPAAHNITYRIISEKHIEMNHVGVQILMSTLREHFWIIRCRKTIRKILQTCVPCKRFSSKPAEVLSGPLPEDRVRDAGIFEVTGVDLFGPLFLKDGRKCWVVLFTCAVFRAIHLELITSLSADGFIQALRRFISRRGRPYIIYSDNGTNFVATSKELNSVDWNNQIEEYATLKKIKWKFNPPAAPWWGGFWERLIRIVKSILRIVLRRSRLDYEELYTVICDTESTVNSRPLTYMSEDPEDLIPLTPEMFLKDIRQEGVPDLDHIEKHQLKRRFAYRQKLKEDLRKRFRKEYLGSLREFALAKKPTNIKEGDLVLVRDSNQKRIQWPMAKVIKLFPGRDGQNRVAKLKTQSGELLRALQSLCPLELDIQGTPNLQLRRTPRARATKSPQNLHA